MFHDPVILALEVVGVLFVAGVIAFFIFLLVRPSRPALLETDEDLRAEREARDIDGR